MATIFGISMDFEVKVKPWWARIFNADLYMAWWGKVVFAPTQEDAQELEAAKTNTAAIEGRALLVHEGTHIQRQRAWGPFAWVFSYVFNKKFRYDEELIAFKNEIEYLNSMRGGRRVKLEWAASQLSGEAYGSMVTYEQALADLKNWEAGID